MLAHRDVRDLCAGGGPILTREQASADEGGDLIAE
jgi:hypothetical protein